LAAFNVAVCIAKAHLSKLDEVEEEMKANVA